MNFKDITTTEEEIIKSLKDAGIEILTSEDAEFSKHPTLKDCLDRIENKFRMLDDLYNITIELNYRETSNSCVVDNFVNLSWNEVCDRGIELLEKLKGDWNVDK